MPQGGRGGRSSPASPPPESGGGDRGSGGDYPVPMRITPRVFSSSLRLAMAIVIVALAGCAAPPPSGPTSPTLQVLADSEWRCTEIAGEAVPADHTITLRFDSDGKVSGSGGVNRFHGTCRIAGGAIEFGPIASTKMAAEPGRMAWEARYFAALQASRRIEMDGDALRLSSGASTTIEFTRR
jgi:heat shock protein HslJ